jgi:uncharacterized protein (TIGR02217 family)
MPSFYEIQFPTDINYGVKGGARYSTSVATAGGGTEQRNRNWAATKGKWDITHALKSESQKDRLIAFFHAMVGKAYGFRFKDWTDYRFTDSYIGTGDGAQVLFQLQKQYTVASIDRFRKITKPVWSTAVDASNVALADTVQVKVNGSPLTYSTQWTIDATAGLVTLASAPAIGDIVTASGEFDVPVRFDTDDMESLAIEFYNTYTWDSVPIVEIRI